MTPPFKPKSQQTSPQLMFAWNDPRPFVRPQNVDPADVYDCGAGYNCGLSAHRRAVHGLLDESEEAEAPWRATVYSLSFSCS